MRSLMVVAVIGLGFSAMDVEASTQKREYCGHQGDIVSALSQAKLDRIPEREAGAHVIANATWPERYNVAVPLYVGEVYKLNRRDLRNSDQGALWAEACMAN